MAADQFCLRWNNFQSNIVTALDSLKTEEDLVDVTLVCEAHAVKAHKVILSACSPYFRNVFKENPCQHPVVILKDVSAEDVEALLSFMYQGEVYICQERLSSFLRTAELLQVRGLTGASAPNHTQQADVPSPVHQPSIASHQASIPAAIPVLRATHRSSKQRSVGSPPPLSVLALPTPSSIPPVPAARHIDCSPQPKRRKAIPRRVPAPAVPPQECVVTKQEPLDEEEMGLCHEEDIKIPMSGEEDIDDGESSRPLGDTTSASQSPHASDESTSMLARSLTAPRNSDASGSHSPLHNSAHGLLESSAGELSPGTAAAATGRPVGGLPRVAQGGVCPHCGQEYANQSSLKYHVRLVHSEMTDRACCHLCPLSFKPRESFKLKQHMKEAHNVHY